MNINEIFRVMRYYMLRIYIYVDIRPDVLFKYLLLRCKVPPFLSEYSYRLNRILAQKIPVYSVFARWHISVLFPASLEQR